MREIGLILEIKRDFCETELLKSVKTLDLEILLSGIRFNHICGNSGIERRVWTLEAHCKNYPNFEFMWQQVNYKPWLKLIQLLIPPFKFLIYFIASHDRHGS